MNISFRAPKVAKEATIDYAMPETLSALVEKFGESEVLRFAQSQIVVALQARGRTMLEDGATPEQIAETFAGWLPGQVVRKSVDPIALLKAKLAGMAPEDSRAILAELRKAATGQ